MRWKNFNYFGRLRFKKNGRFANGRPNFRNYSSGIIRKVALRHAFKFNKGRFS